jgi:glucans biosynthesis protein C
MLKHRLRRIGLPFLIFWPPIFIATVMLVMLYISQMVHGRLSLDPSIMPPPPGNSPVNTMHMWFLYLLLWFCVFTAAAGFVARFIPLSLRDAAWSVARALGRRSAGVLVLAVPLALAGASYKHGIVASSGSFWPPLAEWVHNGMFFVFGLALHRFRDELLPIFQARCKRYAVAGLVFFVLAGVVAEMQRRTPGAIPQTEALIAFVYGCASWFWSFALIGAFLRYLPKQNAFLQYVADSSYWVYLVHMMCTIGFGALLYGSRVGALGIMAINIVATTIVCVLSYQLLVRNTVVGVLLNGRRAGSTPVGEPVNAAHTQAS